MEKIIEEFKSRRAKRLDQRFGGDYQKVVEFRKRRAARLDAKKDDEEGRWVTTENNHKVHISEEGEPDKGNKHVIEAMESGGKTHSGYERYGKTASERLAKRKALDKACSDGLKGYRPVLRMRREVMEAKKSYVHQFNRKQKEFGIFEGVTRENLEQKKEEYNKKIKKLYEREDILEEKTYDCFSEKKLASLRDEIENVQWERSEISRGLRLLDNFDFNKDLYERIKENRKPYDLEYEQAQKDYEDAKDHMRGIIDRYNKQVDEMNAEILKKYPDNDSIKSVEDADEYLRAIGITRAIHRSTAYDYLGEEPSGGVIDIKACDLDTAKGICKMTDRIKEKFPEISKCYRGINVTSSESCSGNVGETDSSGYVSLNEEYFGKDKELSELKCGGGWGPVIESSSNRVHAEFVFSHESGHVLDQYLCYKYPNMIEEVYYAGDGTEAGEYKDSVSSRILERVAKNLGIKKTELKQRISEYACKNDIEAFAEAFGEYIASDRPRPEAAEIGRQIESLYRTGKLLGKEKKE